MKIKLLIATLLLYVSVAGAQTKSAMGEWAKQPPMGWNSYDAYYGSITEKQFLAEVEVLQSRLLPLGYEYAVIDYCWFNPGPADWDPAKWKTFDVDHSRKSYGEKFKGMRIDPFGRLLPAVNRFPSAKGAAGFRKIADLVHAKGMKFGIHMMRGIPRDAVNRNLPVKDTRYSAKDIANTADSCKWNDSMYGVDYTKPGAEAYYNSVIDLYASWGVDFIKVDDIASPVYHQGEIELIRKAIDRSGRKMLLSLSPGDALLGYAKHADQHANMYRISNDVWDRWRDILHLFDLTNNWSSYSGDGSWPDADMLPLGKLCLTGYPDSAANPGKKEHVSYLNADEQKTMMSLWCLARSPLIWGGSALFSPESTFAILSNTELLKIQKNTINNHQLYQPKQRADFADYRIWVAESPDQETKYVAFFNLKNEPAEIEFNMDWEFWTGNYYATELWTGRSGRLKDKKLRSGQIAAHGVEVYRFDRKRPYVK